MRKVLVAADEGDDLAGVVIKLYGEQMERGDFRPSPSRTTSRPPSTSSTYRAAANSSPGCSSITTRSPDA
jgi:hypothetical protein